MSDNMLALPDGRKVPLPDEFRAVASLAVATEGEIGGVRQLVIEDHRVLHRGLNVGRDHTNWIKDRIAGCHLVEGQDFERVEVLTSPNPASSKSRARVAHAYRLTISAAKEVAMMEGNEIGKQVRRFYIWLEGVVSGVVDVVASVAPAQTGLTAREHGGITKGVVNKALDERLSPIEGALVELAQRFDAVASQADARLMDALRRLFPPTKNAPALPPLGYQRFPDYLAEKGIACLTGGEKSGLSRKVVRFCRSRGFNVEDGFGGAYRSGVAFPTYALDCWWRDGGGEVSVMSLVKAHQSRLATRGAPLFPVVPGGKKA